MVKVSQFSWKRGKLVSAVINRIVPKTRIFGLHFCGIQYGFSFSLFNNRFG